MSDKKSKTWWTSFDHVVPDSRPQGVRRLQADRDAKFENRYGRNRPQEQQPHQAGAGEANRGEDTLASDKDPALVDLADLDDARRVRSTMTWTSSFRTQHATSETCRSKTCSSMTGSSKI